MNTESLMMILPAALVGILMHALPLLSRREIFFGVTVDPSFVPSQEARRILFRYRVPVWVASLATLVLLWIGISRHLNFLVIASLFAPVVVSFIAWARAHKQVLPHALPASTVRVASLSTREEPFPGGVLFAIGPVLLLLGAACILYLRSSRGAYAPILVGLCTVVVILLQCYWMLRRARQVRTQGAAAANERTFKRVTVWVLLAAAYGIAIVNARNSLWPLAGVSLEPLLRFLPIAVMAALVLILVRIGQGGSRLPGGGGTDDQRGDATPDACWKWGQLYYNPDDPALLVEKRMGIGWTLNFAHRGSWLILAAAVTLPLLPRLLR